MYSTAKGYAQQNSGVDPDPAALDAAVRAIAATQERLSGESFAEVDGMLYAASDGSGCVAVRATDGRVMFRAERDGGRGVVEFRRGEWIGKAMKRVATLGAA